MSRPRPFHSISWITRDGPGPLLRSIESFAKAAKASGLDYSLFAAQSGQADLIPWMRRLPFHVRLLDRPRIERWSKKIREAADDHGIEKSVIEFALQIAPDEPVTLRNTGANRNALLLAHVDDRFLSCDDDVVFHVHRQPGAKALEAPPSFQANGSSEYRYQYFSNENELKASKEAGNSSDLSSFLHAHESLLGTNEALPGGKVALTISGLLGDCGRSSPRFIFDLSDDRLEELCRHPGKIIAASTSRLVWSAPRTTVLSQTIPLNTACVGFANELCLPPFFPLGRNQDGSYGKALQACLNNVCVAHLNQSITHDPKFERAYSGTLDAMHLRINDLLMLVWDDLLASPIRTSGEDSYRAASLHFLEFAGRSSDDYRERFRALSGKALREHAKKIRAQVTRIERLDALPGFEAWRRLAEREAFICDETSRRAEVGIPHEVKRITADLDAAAAVAREWILQYSKLLAAWPTLRQIAREYRPFDV